MPSPQQLPTQPLGRDGPQVPRLGFGLMGLSIGYGEASGSSDEQRLAVLDRAWELGATLWDTSAAYGDNEDLVGRWFALHPERRDDIFLCTKFGLGLKEEAVAVEGGGEKEASPAGGMSKKMTFAIDSSPAACRASCERSLRRLGVECVDLFYVHRFDRKTPVEETMEELVRLKSEGKIKHIGFSECSSSTLRRGHAVHPITAVQVEYNPWTLDIEGPSGTNLLATCRELGVAVVAYSPLGRGFLTGSIKSLADFPPNDHRRRLPRFSPANFPRNAELAAAFARLAADKGCTPAQAVLAWIAAQGADLFPIPGTTSIARLEENVASCRTPGGKGVGVGVVEISPAEDRRVREIVGGLGGVLGDRSMAMAETFADTPPLGGGVGEE